MHKISGLAKTTVSAGGMAFGSFTTVAPVSFVFYFPLLAALSLPVNLCGFSSRLCKLAAAEVEDSSELV